MYEFQKILWISKHLILYFHRIFTITLFLINIQRFKNIFYTYITSLFFYSLILEFYFFYLIPLFCWTKHKRFIGFGTLLEHLGAGIGFGESFNESIIRIFYFIIISDLYEVYACCCLSPCYTNLQMTRNPLMTWNQLMSGHETFCWLPYPFFLDTSRWLEISWCWGRWNYTGRQYPLPLDDQELVQQG